MINKTSLSNNTTPERPSKKFRNETSLFKGAAEAVPLSRPVWEWSSGVNEWREYSLIESEALEKGFCCQDKVALPPGDSYRVDLRRFIQENIKSGKIRSVRRRLEVIPRSVSVPVKSACKFDGKTLFLNRISGVCDGEGVSVVSFADLLGDVGEIQSILLSTFGTDIEWLLAHFIVGTSITLIDHPYEDSELSNMVPLGNIWPNFRLVHPEFHSGEGGKYGTMHAKLILIVYPNFLRIVVSSANLVQFDWECITQNVWVVDVPRSTSVESAGGQFGTDLQEFVDIILKKSNFAANEWARILNEWRSSINQHVPTDVSLIVSVPGHHTGVDLEKFGHLKLGKVVGVFSSPHVEFQISSIGMLTRPFVEQFCASIGTENLYLLWPEYDMAMHLPGNDHLFLTQRNANLAKPFLKKLVTRPERSEFLNHSKVMHSNKWTYAGSHNLSISAWGRISNNKSLQIASYELGVVLLNDDPHMHIQLPFQPNTSSPIFQPWTRELFVQKVSEILKCTKSTILLQDLKNPIIDSPHVHTIDIFSVDGQHLLAFFEFSKTTQIALVVFKKSDFTMVERFDKKADIEHWLATHDCVQINDTCVDTVDKCVDICVDKCVNGMCQDDSNQSYTLSQKIDANTSLICLDIDGTIVESNKSTELLPNVKLFFQKLATEFPKMKIALVTNQGAVGLRYWMEIGRFGDPTTLPTQAEVETRINAIVQNIREIWPGELHVFMAFRYQSKNSQKWGPSIKRIDDQRWNQDWRKPGPGMIRAAIKAAKVSPFELGKILMVGDMDSDELAAKNAGVRFRKAPHFFNMSEAYGTSESSV